MRYPKKVKESAIRTHIIRFLRRIGAVAGNTQVQGTFDPIKRIRRRNPYNFVGFPDITFFFRNKLYFCEVKRDHSSRLSPHQKEFKHLCDHANVTYIVACCIEDVEKVINNA